MNEELENELDDDLRPEYDFANMKGGVRGKYVERYREGANLIAPDFKTMTVAELRTYAIEHPEDLDSLREILNRRDPNAPKYNFSDTEEGWAQTAEVFRRKFAGEL